MKYLDVLKKDHDIKPYRPELRPFCGSVTATILLQQIIFWSKKSGGKFYKFKQPNNHELYKEGDSWLEELAFGKKEFESAIKLIGFKRGKGINGQKAKSEKEALVVYYTDKERLTWYILNEDLLEEHLKEVYLVNDKRRFTKVNDKRRFTNTFTETTAERERLSPSTLRDRSSLRSQTVKGGSKDEGFFDKPTEWKRFQAALKEPGFLQQFVKTEVNGLWITESEVRAAAKKCFAYNCELLNAPNDWSATLYLWLTKERFEG